ncbi:MAG: hypothetical protein HY561_03465 [Gemmatimonadetes bacterium]|nr:hypothetical protein [Gemmatimonadota bacterium]
MCLLLVALAAAMPRALEVQLRPAAFGKSGALRVWQTLPGERVRLPLEWGGPRPARVRYAWVPVLGTKGEGASDTLAAGEVARAPGQPGVYELRLEAAEGARVLERLRLVVRVPFHRKQGPYLQGYHIGRYPSAQARGARYAPPSGFIEVTRANQGLALSEHFRLAEFLTHDQKQVWPKYAVVDKRILEKLELVLAELNALGYPAEHMVVMSGYRTPQYNGRGLGSGRAALSRHTYGDAADVWVDNDLDGYMDDLNGDGRRDTGDARVILEAAERVEARHPELAGGAGIYPANGVHGPFLHIDARGRRARW